MLKLVRDFPSGPVVKILYFQCRRYRFDLLSGNQDPMWAPTHKKEINKRICWYAYKQCNSWYLLSMLPNKAVKVKKQKK